MLWGQILEKKKWVGCLSLPEFMSSDEFNRSSVSDVEGLTQELDGQNLFPPHIHSGLLEAKSFWLN